jgi:hypothetical protein
MAVYIIMMGSPPNHYIKILYINKNAAHRCAAFLK